MVLIIDTTEEKLGKRVVTELKDNKDISYEYIDALSLDILNCQGCNCCWLKTPGQCVINDEFEPVLKKITKARQVWMVTDTKFGFISYKTKNIIDRLIPIITVNLHFVGKQVKHVVRYDNKPDFGIIYLGQGDKDYLSYWCEKCAININGKSLGVYEIEKYKEAVLCM
ncbi:hypothetical protein SAMN05216249_1227 [Acetitomaculum ruminis DSM 5522]|uniref:Uncharacterized protein n=1 Tax=Acetitomaculum ruminis DSM 5522 TaxID=1120918 RepID=A0A1I1A6L5_9FIRM|nr:NAD(P)H-dependent oxidoreductase [Acetitomaculum ruminis]SFB33605.1 hypothetical protein SAMN05216249_1227 [Acetitomaculum ruminis DSM 5522]